MLGRSVLILFGVVLTLEQEFHSAHMRLDLPMKDSLCLRLNDVRDCISSKVTLAHATALQQSPVYFPSRDFCLDVSCIGLQDTATSAVGTICRFPGLHIFSHKPLLAMSFFELATDMLDDHDTLALAGESQQTHQDTRDKRTQSEDHGVTAKKPRLTQGPSSVAWARTLKDAVRNSVGNFEQRRPLVTASLCSGVNSHTVALKDHAQQR
eukprot:1779013-Amphidinium_carterae.5